jgi:peptidoglycan-associated lipoprotein
MRAVLTLTLAASLVLLLGLVGCGKKQQESDIEGVPDLPGETEETVTVPAEEIPIAEEPAEPVEEQIPVLALKPVFFDFDKHELKVTARDLLNSNGRMLKDAPNVRIIIEGHCDERGTVQYNLALGEKRAKAAFDYLVDLGIDPGRMEVVSYGKERPFAMGHNEEAWAQNRRAHFVQRK